MRAVAYGPDGVLYGFAADVFVRDEVTLVAIDPATGELTPIGTTAGLGTSFVRGMDFRPEDGALFAIAGTVNQLVRVDRVTGSVEDSLGSLAETGLAFVDRDRVAPEIRLLEPRAIAYAQSGTIELDYTVETPSPDSRASRRSWTVWG